MKVVDQSVELIEFMGTDLTVVNAARVSFNKESNWIYGEFTSEGGGHFPRILKKADEKLIYYLANNKHFSPFNHCFLSVRVKAPIFVARQLVKHEYMPWNEVSRRYVDSDPEFYIPKEWRAKAENVKQGSSESLIQICEEDGYNPVMHNTYCCYELYKELLNKGVCPEQARISLPQNTMTEWIWSGSLKAFAKMLQLRRASHTQKETREVAEKVYDIIQPLYPVSINALLGVQL